MKNLFNFILVSASLLSLLALHHKPRLRRQGKPAVRGGQNTNDAILNYRKATQKDPKLGEAYYRLGLASLSGTIDTGL